MDEGPDRSESLERLRRAAYDSFNDRGSYEWKLSLAIWTAQAILVAGLLQPTTAGEPFPLTMPWGPIGAAAVGLVLVIVHGYWSSRARAASIADKKQSYFFRDQMMVGLGVTFPEELQQELERLARGSGLWSPLAQVAITAILAAASTGVVLLRA